MRLVWEESITKAACIPEVNEGNRRAENTFGESQDNSTLFANVLNAARILLKVNFRFLVNEDRVESHDTMLPRAAMEKVLCR